VAFGQRAFGPSGPAAQNALMTAPFLCFLKPAHAGFFMPEIINIPEGLHI
jgi:hypothetical protein